MVKNIYIIDTCVLLHDPNSIYKFKEHDIYLPLAVIDDLDELKTKKEQVGWAAREVFRHLDQFNIQQLKRGVKINNEGGKLFIFNDEAPLQNNSRPMIARVNSDNAIIDASLALSAKSPKRKVIIVTKDTGLRVRAISWSCEAENYKSDLLDADKLYAGYRIIALDDKTIFDDFYRNEIIKIKGLSASLKAELENVYANEMVVFTYDKSSLITIHKNGELRVLKSKNHDKQEFMGISHKNLEQRLALEILDDPDIPLVTLTGPAGTGKAQPLYSSILTPDGFKLMGDIVIGDVVIDGEGCETLVTGVFPQGIKKIFKVNFSDGSSTDCCGDHLWTVQNEYQRVSKKWVTKSLFDLSADIKGHDGRKNYSIPIARVNFKERQLNLDPYLIGVLIGDGGLTGKVPVLSTEDDEILIKIQSLLPPEVKLVHKKESCDYYLSQGKKNGINKLTLNLRLLNLMDKNSWNKFIPYEYLHSSVEQRIKLLQGLMDTDGTIDHRSGQHVSFNTVSEELARDFIWLVRSLGGVCKKTYKNSAWTYKGEKIKKGRSINITVNLPPDIEPFSLERKQKLVIPKTKYKPKKYIESIEENGEFECQCIMVSSENHLYITDDFIVTHNTILSLAVGLAGVNDGLYDRLIVIKPLIPVGGKDIGFLPGSKLEKISAWLGPMKDNILQLVCFNKNGRKNDIHKSSNSAFDEMVEDGLIEVEAMAFIQGRSIPNSFIIVDEAQGLTPREARMAVERCGNGSKIVLLGDLSQIENPYLDSRSCGLAHAINGGKNHFCAATMTLTKVERSLLAAAASEIFKNGLN